MLGVTRHRAETRYPHAALDIARRGAKTHYTHAVPDKGLTHKNTTDGDSTGGVKKT